MAERLSLVLSKNNFFGSTGSSSSSARLSNNCHPFTLDIKNQQRGRATRICCSIGINK
jgi:hypothetical protein